MRTAGEWEKGGGGSGRRGRRGKANSPISAAAFPAELTAAAVDHPPPLLGLSVLSIILFAPHGVLLPNVHIPPKCAQSPIIPQIFHKIPPECRCCFFGHSIVPINNLKMFVNFIIFCCLPFATLPFNLDVDQPVFRHGPAGSWFGFSLAAHFRHNGPILLIGAPRAESGQPGTLQAGAVFACDPGILGGQSPHFRGAPSAPCTRLAVEYSANDAAEWRRVPDRLHSKKLHFEGKNHQMLGFSVQSSGRRDQSRALACAPLLRWGQNAYTDGVCYLLGPELNQTAILNACGPLPKKDRHNDYGACEQGFSAFIDENVILTGLPGARKWTGGVFAKYEFLDSDGFPDSVDRWTMEVDKQKGGILALLASHDYLGYSVRYGRFGFWHEDERNFTVVSGATRYNQTGAVLFLPFHRSFQAEEQRQLGLLEEDRFLLRGRQLGSGFGGTLEVLDLNADGFDDLIVGAPFEYSLGDSSSSELLGGAVYIFYSRGAKQPKGAGNRVFLEPVVLRGQWPHSQFGASLAPMGNLDNDPSGFQDFAVGAPQADFGHGAVLIFHGAKSAEEFSMEPAQQILGRTLRMATKPIQGFGAALAGGVDLDGDGYAELGVGAPSADTAVLFRARPVLEVELGHQFAQKYVKIADQQSRRGECAQNGQSCFSLSTSLRLLDPPRTAHRLLGRAFPSNAAPFLCRLDILPFARSVAPRAVFTSNGANQISWPCGGQQAVDRPEERTFQLHIPKGNQDWTNPLRFNFSIGLPQERRAPRSILPAINPLKSVHLFEIAFDKDCGEDNECHTDLVLSGTLMDLARRETDGKYQAKVTEKDALVLRMLVENRAERAYLAKLYLEYDETELDEPSLVKRKKGGAALAMDIERRERGTAVLALGNPLEAGQKLTFDLLFKLVRGSSERISASLHFRALVNSSSLEDRPEDNEWEAEVQLIKEADLQLAGVSRPPIVHFSRGNARASDEEDIGPQLVHSFLLTNRGPFYARNVTVKIDWPLRLPTSSPNSDWLLYTLEDPLIRHNGHIRRCPHPQQHRGPVNPLAIYNDETLKLDYQMKTPPSIRRPRQIGGHQELGKWEGQREEPNNWPQTRPNSILHRGEGEEGGMGMLWPKSVRENSGEWVRVVDINCKDGTAQCVQLVCHFDYIGANDSALIEIRSRLWNWTFSAEDHRAFDYIALTSEGFIELDPAQGILEDTSNNFARITSHAYPDRPQQEDRVELWILLLAALIGLLLLGLLILICRCCGFFRRKRRPDLHLHQAHYQRQKEEESIVS